MKYALTLLFCGFTLLLLAQEERTDHFFHELGSSVVQSYLTTNSEQIFSSGSTTWVAGTVLDNCRNPSAFYWHNDLELLQTWFSWIPGEDPSNVVEAVWYGDTLILLGIQPCGDGGPAPITRIGKFDSIGNQLMSMFYADCQEDFSIAVEPRLLENTCPVMDVADDGSVLLATTLGLLRMPPGDDLFPQPVDVDIDSLVGIVSLSGTYAVIATHTEVAIVDWATDTILLSLDHTATAMAAADSALWYISEGSLHHISADLSMDAWSLPVEETQHVRLTIYEGHPLVYTPGTSDFNAWLLNLETEAFDPLIDWALDGVEIFAIEPFREDTFIVSGQLINGYRGFVMKTTPASLSFQQPYDIGISSIDLEVLDVESSESLGEYFYRVTFRQEMEVENFGSGLVYEFALEWDARHDWCAEPGYRIINGIELYPGEHYLVTDTITHLFPTSSPFSGELIYTFNTFGPNHYLDANPENDAITGVITDISDHRLPAAVFQLYPNPATGNVQLQSDFAIDQLELYDSFGRLLHTQQLGGLYQATLERQGLPSGLYLLRLRSGSRYGVQRVIWRDN
jgi:hypothetical protein